MLARSLFYQCRKIHQEPRCISPIALISKRGNPLQEHRRSPFRPEIVRRAVFDNPRTPVDRPPPRHELFGETFVDGIAKISFSVELYYLIIKICIWNI